MKKLFTLFAIAATVAVACSKDDDKNGGSNDKTPDDKTEYSGPEQGTSDWSVIGSFAEEKIAMNWDNDLVMAASGDLFVLKNLKLTASDEFKIRYQKSWDTQDRGGSFAELGEGFPVEQGGPNIKPKLDGIYDIYYNPAMEQIAVCAAGKTAEWPFIYRAPVTIDGKYDDWAALDASKMSIATCAAEPKWNGLKVLKVYMDEVYMFVYFEYEDAAIPDKSDVQGHVYFDVDNDSTTGGCANQWTPGCIEYMGEGHFFSANAMINFDPSLSIWVGEPLAEGWEWEEIMPSGSGLFTGKGGDGAYEMALLRESFPELGEEFGFGLDIQQGWTSVGVLPNATLSDENPTGKNSLLTVKMAK